MESMVKMRKVKLAGREFPLAFTLRAVIALQNDPESGFDSGDIRKAITKMDGMVNVLYEMAKDGAELSGNPLDVDRQWFELHIPMNQRKIISIQLAILNTVAEWMTMEAEEDEEEGREIDLVLQEIQKKSGKTD